MKALVIGLGSIGCRHLNNLNSLGISKLAVLRKRKLAPPALIPENITTFTDLEDAVNWDPDIVVIANPTSMHAEYTKIFVKAGAHIYLEKPVSHTMDLLDDIVTLKKKKQVIFVGCMMRFLGALNFIKEGLNNNSWGNLIHIHSRYGEYLPDWHPWEDYRQSYAARDDLGGGVILTLIHEIDYLYWFFNDLKLVSASGGKLSQLDLQCEDTAFISFKTKEGVPIHLELDYVTKPPVREIKILTSNGILHWDYYQEKINFTGHDGIEKLIYKEPESWERNDMFIGAMKNFINSIEGSEKNKSNFYDGVETLKLALDAKKMIKN